MIEHLGPHIQCPYCDKVDREYDIECGTCGREFHVSVSVTYWCRAIEVENARIAELVELRNAQKSKVVAT